MNPGGLVGTVECETVLAEREGFEPSIRQKPYTGFRVQRIRPLCHLSCAIDSNKYQEESFKSIRTSSKEVKKI